MSRITIVVTISILLLSICSQIVRADWSIDIESGIAFNGYNDVRISGITGTNISLSEELKADGTGFLRVRLTKEFNERHLLSLLVAPLRIKASGMYDREVNFNGVVFAAHEYLRSRYRFDSYRLTYRYYFLKSERFQSGIGFTAKIRDAAIKIESSDKYSEKTNTGFVPIINFAFDWRINSKIGLMLEGDALAAPQGRAEDVMLAIYGKPLDNLRFRLGYRILEGGADNDEVYSFTLVNYLLMGVTWSLQ